MGLLTFFDIILQHNLLVLSLSDIIKSEVVGIKGIVKLESHGGKYNEQTRNHRSIKQCNTT